MRVETPFLSTETFRRVEALTGVVASPNSSSSELQSWGLSSVTAGGACWSADDPKKGFLWEVASEGTELHLSECHLDGRATAPAVAVVFGSRRIVSVAATLQDESPLIAVLQTGGVLHMIRLESPRDPGSPRIPLHSLQSTNITRIDLPPRAGATETFTNVVLVDGHVILWGSTDGVLCVPWLAALQGQMSESFILQVASGGLQQKLTNVLNVFGRPQPITLCHLFALPGSSGRPQLLGAVLSNAVLRLFNVSQRYAVHTEVLRHDGGSQAVPVAARTSHSTQTGEVSVLVVDFATTGALVGRTTTVHTLQYHAGRVQVKLMWQEQGPAGGALVGCAQKGDVLYIARHDQGSSRVSAVNKDLELAVPVMVLEESPGMVWSITGASEEDQDLMSSLLYGAGCQDDEVLLERLVVPWQRSGQALRSTLMNFGVNVPLADCQVLTVDQLRPYVVNILDSLAARQPQTTRMQCWVAFLSIYREQWSRCHPLLSLVTSRGEWLGALRGGGLLTVMREPSIVEHGLIGRGLEDLHPGAQLGLGLHAAWGPLMEAARDLCHVVGPPLMELAVHLSSQGIDPKQLLPILGQLLMEGPGQMLSSMPSASRTLTDTQRQRRVSWRQARLCAVISARQKLTGVDDVVDALRCLVESLSKPREHGAAVQTQPDHESPSHGALAYTLTAAVAQHHHALALSLLQLGVLVEAIADGPGTGDPLTSPDLRLECESLRLSAMVLSLCSLPVTEGARDLRGSQLTTQALQHLTLGRTATGAPRAKGQELSPSRAGARALATVLLQDHMEKYHPFVEDDLTTTALKMFSSIQTAVLPTRASAVRDLPCVALMLGAQLYRRKEVLALQRVVALLGSEGGGPHRQFLRGLGHLGAFGTSRSTTDRKRHTVLCCECFFSSAAGLREQGDQVDVFWSVVETSTDQALPMVTNVAQRVLDFLLRVSKLLADEKCLEGALEVALAATEQVPHAFPSAADKDTCRQEQGKLWHNICGYHCDLQQYPQAYLAVTSNPDPDMALDSMKHLTNRMCDRGHLRDLCGLPLAGTVTVEYPKPLALSPFNGRIRRRVPWFQVVVDTLVHRALQAPTAVLIAQYQVLYDFLVKWSSYREAAAAMLSCAWRLRAGGTPQLSTLKEVLHAYATTISTLSLVEDTQQWLDVAHPLLASARHERKNLQGTAPLPHQSPVVTLRDIQEDFVLVRAAVALGDLLPAAMALSWQLSVDLLLPIMLARQSWQDAMDLVEGASRGPQQAKYREEVVAALAEHCGRVQLQQRGTIEASSSSPLDLSSSSSHLAASYLGSSMAAGWNLLRSYLNSYDTSASGREVSDEADGMAAGSLAVRVADVLLGLDLDLSLPQWLQDMFKASDHHGLGACQEDPGGLLRVYLKHDRLAEASALVVEYLMDWDYTDPIQRVKPLTWWAPYTSIEALHRRLGTKYQQALATQSPSTYSIQYSLVALEEALLKHLKLVQNDSQRFSSAPRPSVLALQPLQQLLH